MNMNLPLSERIKIVNALDYVSGTADRNGATVDMAEWDGCLMIVKFATIAAGGTNFIKAQQDTDAAGGTMADLEGTKIAVAADDDNQIFAIDIFKPTERYLRLVVDKDGANACAESAFYVLYAGRKLPNTLSVTDLVTAETHVSPAEGTA